MLKLNNLSSPKGAHKNTKRLGRGQASGQGTQGGKGHKGHKARSSGHVRSGFEGGGVALYMRLPKKGFKNFAAKEFSEITLDRLFKSFEANETVSPEILSKKGILKGKNRRLPVKILGAPSHDSTPAILLNFKGISNFSSSAKKILEKVGASIKIK